MGNVSQNIQCRALNICHSIKVSHTDFYVFCHENLLIYKYIGVLATEKIKKPQNLST